MANILIILPNLAGGGAERLHINLANDWVSKGHRVQFALLDVSGELLSLVSKKIEIIDLGCKRLRTAGFRLYKLLRNSRYDVVIAALWPLTSICITAWVFSGRWGRLYVSEHSHLSISLQEQKIPAYVFRLIISSTHRFASGVIAVSNGVRDDLSSLAHLPREAIKVIYNPAATGRVYSSEPIDAREDLWGKDYNYHILSVGSLRKAKDHAALIRSFSQLPQELNAKLIILGEGPLRYELEGLVSKLGIQEKVSMPGFVTDPHPWFRSANLFVLSSRWEGFGDVIVEALECGVPVVSTDCPSGPSEILDNGIYGKLVPVGNDTELATAMAQSFCQDYDREILISRAEEFSVRNISDQYLAYIFPVEG